VTFRDWVDLSPLDRLRPLAPLAVRAFLCVYLLYMSQDNVRSGARMDEFTAFLTANGFPVPGLAARVSVYAQLVCGALVGLGLLTRWAAAVMVFHFVVAILGAHLDLPFRTTLEPAAMLCSALFLLLNGPGSIALDSLRRRRPEG
jgi:putative oxidoreductase